tara:strand:- start:153 stop:428 length:276 start_codon:yes stop_codon:yes gene_type:complete
MIRILSRKVCSALNIFNKPVVSIGFRDHLFPEDEINKMTGGDSGYRVLIDVCHETKTVYVDHDMCDYDELNDLPRIIKTIGCLYPKYNLKS